jgi:putative hydrolase of the HAD superfamily
MVGAASTEQWRQVTAEVVGAAAVEEWLGYHGDLNHEVVECLQEVRGRGMRVVLLSNATGRLRDDLAFHHLDDLADAVFCSAEIGLAKPEPAAYHYAARHGGFNLHRALYVDDTPSWVAAGVEVGLHGHVFESAPILVKDLKAHGLLP